MLKKSLLLLQFLFLSFNIQATIIEIDVRFEASQQDYFGFGNYDLTFQVDTSASDSFPSSNSGLYNNSVISSQVSSVGLGFDSGLISSPWLPQNPSTEIHSDSASRESAVVRYGAVATKVEDFKDINGKTYIDFSADFGVFFFNTVLVDFIKSDSITELLNLPSSYDSFSWWNDDPGASDSVHTQASFSFYEMIDINTFETALRSSSGTITSLVAREISDNNEPKELPEPSTLAIFALGMIGLASRRFKKKS